MKSEHRHELAENDLSKLISRVLDEHLNKILWGIIVIGFASAVAIYWSRTSANARSVAWTQLASAQSAGDLENVADSYPRSPAADWARLRAAEMHLRQGISQSTRDRPTSDDELKLAQEGFDALLKNTAVPPEVREQALNGLAVTLESLSGGDTSDAIAAYEQLLKEFPDSRFARYANDRIDALKTGRVQEFYAWFRSQNPQPPAMPLPQDGAVGSSLPLDLQDLGGEASSSLQDLLNKPDQPGAGSTDGNVNPFPEPLTGEDPEAMPEGDNPFPPPLTSSEPAKDEADKPQNAPTESEEKPPAESDVKSDEQKEESPSAPQGATDSDD